MSKTVLITGISRGIGRAIAKMFYDHDYKIVGCSKNPESIRAFMEDYNLADVQACDVAEVAQIKQFAAYVNEHYEIDVLVNNAGVFLPGAMLEEDDAQYEQMMRINVDSVYHLTKAIVPKMRERKSGTIVNICSIASIMAYAAGGSYAVTKHAMLGMSRAMREELKPDGVRVVSVLPGATLTDSWAGVDLPEDRFVSAESVAQMVYTASTLPSTAVVEELIIRPQLGDI